MKTFLLPLSLLLASLSLTLATPSLPNYNMLLKRCPPFDPAGVKNIGNGAGVQFVGGQCLSDADCGQGCCAKPCGICSGPLANFQNGKQGCGFSSGSAGNAATTGTTGSNDNGSGNTSAGTGSGTTGSNNTGDETGTGNTGTGNGNGKTNSCTGN